jgi:hypothetical protein
MCAADENVSRLPAHQARTHSNLMPSIAACAGKAFHLVALAPCVFALAALSAGLEQLKEPAVSTLWVWRVHA